MVDASVWRTGIISCCLCLRWIRRWINCCVMWMKSSCFEFCIQYWMIFPVIRPLKQLAGRAELGGMFKYNVRFFWCVFVMILKLSIWMKGLGNSWKKIALEPPSHHDCDDAANDDTSVQDGESYIIRETQEILGSDTHPRSSFSDSYSPATETLLNVIQFCHLCDKGKIPLLLYSVLYSWFSSYLFFRHLPLPKPSNARHWILYRIQTLR